MKNCINQRYSKFRPILAMVKWIYAVKF